MGAFRNAIGAGEADLPFLSLPQLVTSPPLAIIRACFLSFAMVLMFAASIASGAGDASLDLGWTFRGEMPRDLDEEAGVGCTLRGGVALLAPVSFTELPAPIKDAPTP